MTRSEAILEARRKIEAGEFDRAVTGIEPADLTWDTLKLECGHTGLWCAKIRIDKTPPQQEKCSECAKAWVAENTTEVTL
jgi:hypothetical protein